MKIHCVTNILLTVSGSLLYENNCDYDSYKFVLILFLFLSRIQKQESNLRQVSGLVTRNVSFLFIASHVLLISVDFYKGILLSVIPIRIIVPWWYSFECFVKIKLSYISLFWDFCLFLHNSITVSNWSVVKLPLIKANCLFVRKLLHSKKGIIKQCTHPHSSWPTYNICPPSPTHPK